MKNRIAELKNAYENAPMLPGSAPVENFATRMARACPNSTPDEINAVKDMLVQEDLRAREDEGYEIE